MKSMRSLSAAVCALILGLGLGGCSDMSRRDRDTAIGASIGALGGAILTGGSALGTSAAKRAMRSQKSLAPWFGLFDPLLAARRERMCRRPAPR